MRYAVPIYQRAYHKRYDALRGKRILSEQTGFIKEASRALGVSGLLGIDPKAESGLMLNRVVPSKFEANAHLADFIDRYQGITKDNMRFITQGHKEYINIGQTPFNLHQIAQKGNFYYVITQNNSLNKPTVPLKVIAKDKDELASKLELIFTNPVARAKLEFKTPKIPVLHRTVLEPGHGHYVFLNETKVMPNAYLQEFESINTYTKADEFDTALGAASVSQINYHVADNSRNHYSDKKNGETFTTIVDDFGIRLNNMTEHLLSSNITDELMGNIINMYDTKNRLLPEQRGQMVRKLCEDYVYNHNGKGTVNNRKRSHAPANFSYDTQEDSLWKQFQLTANPFRGGRMWRDIPFSLEQTLLAFYSPTATGKRKCKYDIDAEKFKTEIRKIKVKPSDRQFMAAYGRKILGTYVTLKMLSDEIALVDLKDTKNAVQNKKKWTDLNALHDELFEAAGDMRDFLRTHASGFGQSQESVKKNIPDFAPSKNKDAIENAAFNKDKFIAQSKKNLYNHIKDYTYMENFMGWHIREDLGWELDKSLSQNVYQNNTPRVISNAATVMLIEGLDNLSRELKYIESCCERDTNGRGRFNHLLDKFKFGDINGFKEFLAWDKNHLLKGLNAESHFPSPKRQALQAEGIIMEKPYFPPMKRAYFGENQGFFTANPAASRISYQYRTKTSQDFVDFMHLCGTHLKKIQTEMKQKNITDMYETKALKEFDILLRDTAKDMATDYLHDKRTTFSVLSPKESKRLHFEIQKKIYHFLQLNANVAGLLANAPEIVYH